MVRPMCLVVFTLVAMMTKSARAQGDSRVQLGMWSARFTLSPSYQFAMKESFFYLHGNLENYVRKNVSLIGEGYYFLGASSAVKSRLENNSSVFLGASFHKIKNASDVYFGVQPGLAFTQVQRMEAVKSTQMGVVPLVSLVAGYNYYFSKYCHFFVHGRFITGEHLHNEAIGLSEVRVSAGLGFQIR